MPEKFDRLFNQSQGDELIDTLKGIKNSLDANFPLEDIDVELTANSQLITPSEGYFGINSVNIPGESPGSIQIMTEKDLYNCFNVPVEIANTVTDCSDMFSLCLAFNSPVNIPDSVECISGMFKDCNSLNAPITMNENMVVNYADMMFSECTNYNQPTVFPHSVEYMRYVFTNCTNLNAPITLPTYQGCDFADMFQGCVNFNQPITLPEYGMFDNMFNGCDGFNQPLRIPEGGSCYQMLANCNSFNSPVVFEGVASQMEEMFNPNMSAPVYIMNAEALDLQSGTFPNSTFNITEIYLLGYVNSDSLKFPYDYGKRINVYTDDNSIANMATIIDGDYLDFQTNAANNCTYNTYYNLYFYNNWDGTVPIL